MKLETSKNCVEMFPDPEPQPDLKRPSKQDVVIAMLRLPEGATVDEVASVTGWQRSRRLLRNLEEKARTHACLGQRGAWPGLPHRRAGRRMKSSVHDASARQHSGEPFSGLDPNGSRRNDCETRTCLGLVAKLPDWSIARRRSCGVRGRQLYHKLDRPRASVVI
jgi:Protein of unknown function (DUF3489)